jgi:predicted RNA polymerase sigma factor
MVQSQSKQGGTMKYLALVYPADLLRRLGRDASARGADERALAPTDNGDERRFLERQLTR